VSWFRRAMMTLKLTRTATCQIVSLIGFKIPS
jgi:hypothetical protein